MPRLDSTQHALLLYTNCPNIGWAASSIAEWPLASHNRYRSSLTTDTSASIHLGVLTNPSPNPLSPPFLAHRSPISPPSFSHSMPSHSDAHRHFKETRDGNGVIWRDCIRCPATSVKRYNRKTSTDILNKHVAQFQPSKLPCPRPSNQLTIDMIKRAAAGG